MGLPSTPLELQLVAEELVQGSKVIASKPLDGGISADMMLVTLQTSTGNLEKLVLRKPGDWGDQEYETKPGREFRKYQLAHANDLLAPEPVRCFDDFFVLKFIEGSPNLQPSHAPQYVNEAARHIAKVHRSRLGPADLGWLPTVNAAPTGDRWQPQVRDLLLEYGHPRDEVQTLCHGDCWPGNILWQGDRVVGLIDWEEVSVGSPLTDLAITRLDLFFIYDWETVHAFTKSYVSHHPVDTTHLAYWDLRCSQRIGDSYDVWADSYPPHSRSDVTGEILRRKQGEFVIDAIARLG